MEFDKVHQTGLRNLQIHCRAVNRRQNTDSQGSKMFKLALAVSVVGMPVPNSTSSDDSQTSQASEIARATRSSRLCRLGIKFLHKSQESGTQVTANYRE